MTTFKCVRTLVLLFAISNFQSVFSAPGDHQWERTNAGGGGAISMVGATKNGTLITASDLSGVYTSINKGKKWIARGENQGLKEGGINSLGFPNLDDTFLMGTYLGVYKSKDNGDTIYQAALETKKPNTDGLIESMGMSISEPQIGYLAHHEDWEPKLTFMKTTDAGDSWKIVPTVGIPEKARIIKIIVDRTNSSIVYALTGKARFGCGPAQLYKSSNGGLKWSRVAANIDGKPADILDVDLHPTDSNKFYVSTFKAGACIDGDGNPQEYTHNENADFESYIGERDTNYPFYNVYTTNNSGVSFTSLTDNKFETYSDAAKANVKRGITGIINVDYENPDTIRIVNILHPFDWNNLAGTWESNDAGSTWTKNTPVTDWQKGFSGQYISYVPSFYGLAKTVTKDVFNSDNMFGSFGQWAWGSVDGGHHLNNVSTESVAGGWHSTGVENINGHAIDINDKDPNVIYVGTIDAGFWASQDHGQSWKRSQPDFIEYPLYSWNLGKTPDPAYAKIGNGSNVYTVLSDPDDPKKVWASFGRDQYQQFGDDGKPTSVFGLFKSTNSGVDWDLLDSGLPKSTKSVRIYGLSLDKSSPVGNRTLFVTVDGTVYKSINDGTTWKPVLVPSSPAKALKFTQVDQKDPNIVYAGGEGGLWVSTDGGTNWAQMGGSYKTEMQGNHQNMRNDIVPTDDATHYDNNGDEVIDIHAWEGVFDIKTDPNNKGWVYVTALGKGKGLYLSKDSGKTWEKLLSDDLMRGIAVAPQDSKILYATSSSSYYSGGKPGSSGIQFSSDGGKTWKSANQGMAWNYGGMIEIEHGENPNVWAWSPGTGVQFSPIPVAIVLDSDNDGIPDAWEDTYGLDKNNPLDAIQDLDLDGLSNLQEFTLGTLPNNKDTDGDGADDGYEISSGTDPLNANSVPAKKIPSLSTWGILLLTFLLALFGLLSKGMTLRHQRSF